MFQRVIVYASLWFLALVVNAAAQPANDLQDRIAYWQERAFICPSAEGGFPSKEGEGGAPSCDDGDSIMFNALLCRAGDPRGCNAVKLSQDADGRFWRSPNKRAERPAEATGLEHGQTSFSGDHAAGLVVYFGHAKDSESFSRWIKWIDSNERCTSFCGAMPVGTPRYCKNDRCALRVGDCQVLTLLGERLKVGVPFCSIEPFTPVPTMALLAQTLKNAYDATLKKLSVQLPEVKLLRDNFDGALKTYEDAVAPIEALRTRVVAAAVRALALAQIEKALSARFNERGYSRHNALVQIMALQDWGLGSPWMASEAQRVAADEPLNPFFQYVAHRRASKSSMLPLILAECPSRSDPQRLRRQWSWERDTAKREWVDSMYWDCLFIASAYSEGGAYPPDHDNQIEAALRQELNSLIARAESAWKAAEEWLAQLNKFSEKPLDAARDILEKKAEEVKQNPAAILVPPSPIPLPSPRNPLPLPVPGMKF